VQIFCDESGGTDAANELFLVAALAIVPGEAVRLIKSFRKATKLKAEIKGHELTYPHRRIFFELITSTGAFDSVVVSSSRHHQVGGWAMGSMAEAQLYSHLLLESCLGVLKTDSPHLTITPDGGRYKKAQCHSIAAQITQALMPERVGRVSVKFQNSAEFSGLQVVDVIANTAFQALGNSSSAEAARELLDPLLANGRIVLRHVELERARPDWLA
jgi:hypothetical protein